MCSWFKRIYEGYKLQALSPSYVITRLNRHRLKLISLYTAPEGEKTPYMSRLRFHVTLLEYSDRDVI